MISFVVTLLVMLSLAWLAYHVIGKYREADGPAWDRVLAGFKDSATVLLAGATYVGGAVVNLVGKLADAANAPEVAELLRTQVPPEYAGFGLMAMAVLIFIARLRTL